MILRIGKMKKLHENFLKKLLRGLTLLGITPAARNLFEKRFLDFQKLFIKKKRTVANRQRALKLSMTRM
jgi:hypothetical protein